MDQKLAVPTIAIDLDGVVWHQGKYVEGSKEALNLLTKDLRQIDVVRYGQQSTGIKLPYYFVTNSGHTTEQNIANQMNEQLNLPSDQLIDQEHFILNYTPLRNEMKKYTDKVVLISGFVNSYEIMTDCGMNKYITMEEYAKIYPQLLPNNRFTEEDRLRTVEILRERLEFENDSPFSSYIQVHAVFLSYMSNHVEIVTQLLCDVLSTTDGTIPLEVPKESPPFHIPVYSVANDYFFPSRSIHLNRLGWGMYMDSIQEIYKKAYNREMVVQRCGKPSELTFRYAQNKAFEMAQRNGMKLTRGYMIGDNPNTDVKGAKKIGWETILVRTGVYQGQPIQDIDEQPTVIVENLKDAIEYIFAQENIKCDI